LNTTYGAVNDSPDENFTEITGGIERMIGVDDMIRIKVHSSDQGKMKHIT
jgi:hypothetical protein